MSAHAIVRDVGRSPERARAGARSSAGRWASSTSRFSWSARRCPSASCTCIRDDASWHLAPEPSSGSHYPPRDLAILPILLGSIATGWRSWTARPARSRAVTLLRQRAIRAHTRTVWQFQSSPVRVAPSHSQRRAGPRRTMGYSAHTFSIESGEAAWCPKREPRQYCQAVSAILPPVAWRASGRLEALSVRDVPQKATARGTPRAANGKSKASLVALYSRPTR